MKNNIIYYMGPSPAREGRPIGSAGPTTASRMDKYAPDLLDLGLKGIIKFVNKHAEIWKFIKFTFTGASTSVLELAVFWVLQYVVFKSLNEVPVTDNAVLSFLGIEYKGYMYSYFISAVIGYAAAYIMNRKLTFKADANPILSTVLYTIMVICTITFNTWFGSFLGTLIKNSGHDSVFIVLLTKLIVMTVPTLWTYPLNRFVIHRKKKA